jgi:TonB family protein
MFEKMVVSSEGRRERRLSKFFLGSSLAYMLLAGSALAVSIYISNPRLVGSGAGGSDRPLTIQLASGSRHAAPSARVSTANPNPYSVRRLDDLPRTPEAPRPPRPTTDVSFDQIGMAAGSGGESSNGDGGGRLPGAGSGGLDVTGDPPRPAETPRRSADPKQIEQPKSHPPIRVSTGVLQGKAIDRKTPDYPQIARLTHREGSVLVEVMISPEGRVESARAVSGDALLARNAVDAAYGWRFQPTYLGDVPVRVTGIITFVFKMGQ